MTVFVPAPLVGNDLASYTALQVGCAYFKRTDLHHLAFAGGKAADVLTGLVTNDVLALEAGRGQYAAALTAKGKMVADMRVLCLAPEYYLTTTTTSAWEGWRALVGKYVNPRLAKYQDEAWQTLSLFGPTSPEALRAALSTLLGRTVAPSEVPSHAPYSVASFAVQGQTVHAVRSPVLGAVSGFDLLVPAELSLEPVIDALSNVVAGTDEAWQVARIECARPLFGVEMNDSTIPQEANLGQLGALSFDKGCYTGQETVARIHFRGHVNRHLRLIASTERIHAPSDIRKPDGTSVGEVRSAAISPARGPIGIGMVRRELVPGDVISLVSTDADGSERVVSARIEQ